MDVLNALDTSEVEPMSHVFPVKNVLRPDVVEPSADRAELLRNAPVPDQEAAKYLVSCGLKGVGTDALSVDTLRDEEFLAHKTLLEGGLVILESLCLKKVAGRRDLMLFALPLKFENADGAPVRAIAEFRDFPEEKEMEAL